MNTTFETNPYKATWRFIRYDEYEIFEADDAYFDRQAREIKEAGFTHVMTFSNTHFRWSFRRDFERLTEVLRRQVAACHKYGLYIVEHHSANLSWNYQTEAQKERPTREVSSKYWPHFWEDMDENSTYRGVNFHSMQQVSGETGKPFISFFNAYIMCHNNPDYLKFYLEYLETLYQTKIDGIMTDDIQFISEMRATDKDNVPIYDMNSCTCKHCRAKFKALTNCDLPADGKDFTEFLQDQTTPLFLKWKEFRYQSSVDFNQLVVDHYKSLGLKMMRPNYSATSVAWVSPWAFVYDDLPALDWGFVEHCCGFIRYSYPEYIFESMHCNMLTRHRNIPAMSLYYPTSQDQQRLSWALSLFCGHRYLGDPRKEHLFAEQKRFHQFEEEHYDSLFEVKQSVRTGFLDSQMGRELDPDYNTTTRTRFNSMAQACTKFNIPWTMVNFQNVNEFKDFEVIIVPGTKFLADDEIIELVKFAQNGGTLVWCDKSGSFDRNSYRPRSYDKLKELIPAHSNLSKFSIESLGKGKFVYLSESDLLGSFIKRCRADGEGNRDAFDCSEPTRWRPLNASEIEEYQAIANFVNNLLGSTKDISCNINFNDLLISTYYSTKLNNISIRIANTVDTMNLPELSGFGDSDKVPFPKFASEALTLNIRKPKELSLSNFTQATLFTLDGAPVEVKLIDNGDTLSLNFDASNISDFTLIELT